MHEHTYHIQKNLHTYLGQIFLQGSTWVGHELRYMLSFLRQDVMEGRRERGREERRREGGEKEGGRRGGREERREGGEEGGRRGEEEEIEEARRRK